MRRIAKFSKFNITTWSHLSEYKRQVFEETKLVISKSVFQPVLWVGVHSNNIESGVHSNEMPPQEIAETRRECVRRPGIVFGWSIPPPGIVMNYAVRSCHENYCNLDRGEGTNKTAGTCTYMESLEQEQGASLAAMNASGQDTDKRCVETVPQTILIY